MIVRLLFEPQTLFIRLREKKTQQTFTDIHVLLFFSLSVALFHNLTTKTPPPSPPHFLHFFIGSNDFMNWDEFLLIRISGKFNALERKQKSLIWGISWGNQVLE